MVASLITARNRRHREDIPAGWRPIYDRLLERLASLDPEPEVLLAKEKFASLSVYLEPWVPAAAPLIEEARREAEAACQVCGAPAKMYNIDHVVSRFCPIHV
jgi:hypothetical protein